MEEKNVGTKENFFFIIDCGIALKEVPLTPGPEAVSIEAHESE